MGTLITGEATDVLRMGVKILSESEKFYAFFCRKHTLSYGEFLFI